MNDLGGGGILIQWDPAVYTDNKKTQIYPIKLRHQTKIG